jgi:excisionase family DNA binding protein
MQKLLTLKEIASPAMPLSTLTKWAREEYLPAFKLGKKWVIREEDLDNFLNKKKEEHQNSPLLDDKPISQKVGQDEF